MTTAFGSTIEHRIGSEGLLAVRIRSGVVRLRATDGDVVLVRETNDLDLQAMLSIEKGEGSLSLRSGQAVGFVATLAEWTGYDAIFGSQGGRAGGRHTPELEIDVPRRATVVVEAANGDLQVDGLLGDQRYRTASGDVTLRAVSGKVDVEVVSGDVDIVAAGTADVVARTVSGDLAVRAAILTRLQATTTSGDLRIVGQCRGAGPFTIESVSGDALLAPAGDIGIEMNTVTGDLSSDIDGPSVHRGRRSLSIGQSGPTLTFRSMSGDLRVVRPVAIPTPADQPPTAPQGQPPAEPPANHAIAAAYEEARLRILKALERGEIDVAEAGRRLETLDDGEPGLTAADQSRA